MRKLLFFPMLLLVATPSFAFESKLTCIVHAYGQYLNKITTEDNGSKTYVIMKNGAKILARDTSRPNPSFAGKLANPTLEDTVSLAYPRDRDLEIIPAYNDDPGRFRNIDFFKAVYGATKSDVENNLVKVRWLPKTLVHPPLYVLFNHQNSAALALQHVSDELDNLPPPLKKYVLNIAGTYSWRLIANTDRPSAHSFGIAIDINPHYSNYWHWEKGIIYRNNIPRQIVDIFEKYGFIWGGRWYHYDTMHFEYRPEFVDKICRR